MRTSQTSVYKIATPASAGDRPLAIEHVTWIARRVAPLALAEAGVTIGEQTQLIEKAPPPS